MSYKPLGKLNYNPGQKSWDTFTKTPQIGALPLHRYAMLIWSTLRLLDRTFWRELFTFQWWWDTAGARNKHGADAVLECWIYFLHCVLESIIFFFKLRSWRYYLREGKVLAAP